METHRKKNVVTAALAALLIFIVPLILWSYPSNPPTGRTGAPGESTCTSCHSQSTTYTGNVTIGFPSGVTTYTPGGPAIPITVTVAAGSIHGFEMTAVQASATSNGAGTMTAANTSTTSIRNGSSGTPVKQYAAQTSDTVTSWTVNWTPPATNIGNVVFYAAGLAGNNNGGSSGDSTFTTNSTLTPAAAGPTMSVTPTSLTFNYTQNGTVPTAQNLSVSSSGTALSYTVSDSATWLTVSPTSGTTPGTVAVSVNPSTLGVGTYNGTITITSTGASNGPQTVPVTLNVIAAPTLTASPSTLSYAYQIGGTTPAAQTVNVTSSGGALSYTTSTSATWLTASPASGTTPGSVSVAVNPATLPAGIYTGSVTITSSGASNSPQTVSVTLTVTAAPTLSLSPSTLSFAYQIGGTTPAAQTVSVASSGSALSYTVSDNATWMTVTPTSGTTPGSLSVSVSPSTLTAGTYTGTITVTAAGASNGPQTVAVTLVVSSSPGITLSPSTLSFAYTVGGTTPAAQTVSVTSSGAALSYTTSTSATWLSATPASGTTPGSVSVSANPTGMSAGTYTGTVTVTASGASNGPQVVTVTLTVANPNIVVSPASLSYAYQINGATPAAQTLSVTSSAGALSYTTSTSATWLSATPASGTTPGSVSVTVNPAGLGAGTFSGTVTIASTGAANSQQTVAVTLTVTAAPTMTATPGTLSFAYTVGGTTPAAQSVSVTSSGAALSYTVSDNATWLTVTPSSGTTPGSVSVSANPSGMAAGTYNGTVTIASTGAGNSPQTVAVSLTVNAAPTLSASPGTLSFAYSIGGSTPSAQSVSVSSSSSALSYTVSTNAAWLSATPASGTTPGSVSVSVSPSALTAGTYNGTVTIASTGASNGPQTVAVTLTVAASNTALLTVSPTSLSFAAPVGGTASTQRLTIGSSSSSSLDFRGMVDQPWLMITSAVGPTPGYLDIGINTAGLAAGVYNGDITLLSSTAGNSPVVVPVTLTVGAPVQAALSVSPGTLNFAYTIGSAAPAAQSVSVGSSGAALNYTAAASGGTWLSVSPTSGTTPGNLSVAVNTSGLAAGTYSGAVTITSANASNSPQVVNVTLTVTSGPSLSAAPKTLTFYYHPGDAAPSSQAVSVGSSGAALSYTASYYGGTWLTATPAGGTTTSTVNVAVAPAGLAAGTYSGVLQLSATNTTAAVPVTLIVSSTVAGPDGVRLDPVPFTFDTTGTNGVSSVWVYGAGNNANNNNDALQGLVLVKNGSSSTDAQAGVHIQGVAGLSLNELGFDIRTGQCTASGPHFAVVTSDSTAHVLPCGSGVLQASPAAGWQRVRFDLSKATPAIAAGQGVTSIDLVLSAGPDSNSGFAVIDNLDVNGKIVTKP